MCLDGYQTMVNGLTNAIGHSETVERLRSFGSSKENSNNEVRQQVVDVVSTESNRLEMDRRVEGNDVWCTSWNGGTEQRCYKVVPNKDVTKSET